MGRRTDEHDTRRVVRGPDRPVGALLLGRKPLDRARVEPRAVPWWAWAVGVAVLVLVIGAVAVVVPTDEGKQIKKSTLETRPTSTTTTLPPAAVAPAPATGGCDPNYSGCVPIASDVDCAGGSGNGPAYAGPVQVIGSDIYDLDSNGDGYACES